MTYSIQQKDLFKIEDQDTNTIYHGTNQEWYKKRWQRMAGCGPSAVANIIYYFNCISDSTSCCPSLTKEECIKVMEEIWNYVTPNLGGVSSTEMLLKGVKKYMQENKLDLAMDVLDIPKKVSSRPETAVAMSFVAEALSKDRPVAFLNLEHGTVHELESWHWVTIISLDYETDGQTAFIDILDGGYIKRIDLQKWLKTTKMGGGFVSIGVK